MKKAIVIQMIILIVAWIITTPDVAQDNTYLFGLIGDVEVVRGNSIWVMLSTMVASVCNIWFWWPKAQGVADTPSEKPAESTKGEVKEIKSEENDPVVPKMD